MIRVPRLSSRGASKESKESKNLVAAAQIRRLNLIPVLELIVQASAAFPPLQSVARGLIDVMGTVEVWLFFSILQYPSSYWFFVAQMSAQLADVAELETVLSQFVTLLNGPLQNGDSCPPALMLHITDLFRLSLSFHCNIYANKV